MSKNTATACIFKNREGTPCGAPVAVKGGCTAVICPDHQDRVTHDFKRWNEMMAAEAEEAQG